MTPKGAGCLSVLAFAVILLSPDYAFATCEAPNCCFETSKLAAIVGAAMIGIAVLGPFFLPELFALLRARAALNAIQQTVIDVADTNIRRSTARRAVEKVTRLLRERFRRSEKPSSKSLDPDETDVNKLNHIFGRSEHNLENIVAEHGGDREALRAIKAAVDGRARLAVRKNGTFEVSVRIGVHTVTVRGAIIDGVVRIGTAFIPRI